MIPALQLADDLNIFCIDVEQEGKKHQAQMYPTRKGLQSDHSPSPNSIRTGLKEDNYRNTVPSPHIRDP